MPSRRAYTPPPSAVAVIPEIPRIRRPYPMSFPLPVLNTGITNGENDFNLPIGFLYRLLLLKITGITLAKITGIQLLMNDELRWDIANGSDLNLMNMYDGMADYGVGADGILALNFMRSRLTSKTAQLESGLNTGQSGMVNGQKVKGIEKLTLRIKCAGLVGGETIVPWAVASDSVASDRGAGNVRSILKKNLQFQGAIDDAEVSDMPQKSAKNALLSRILVIPSVPASIDVLKLSLDGAEVRKLPVDLEDFVTENINPVHFPQADVLYTIDSTQMGFGNEPFPIFDEKMVYALLVTTNQATLARAYADMFGLL